MAATEQLSTVIERPRGPHLSPATTDTIGLRDTVMIRTPADALHLEEARRTLLVTLFMYMLVAAIVAVTFAIGGDPTYRAIHVVGLAITALVTTWVAWAARNPARYRSFHGLALGHAGGFAVTCSYPYWGVFSASLMVVPFGILLFGLGKSARGSASIAIAAMVAHAAISVLTIVGVIPDRGIIRLSSTNLGVGLQLLLIGVAQLIFLTSFVLARQIRKVTVDAYERLDDAARELSQRDAILDEARLDLRDMLQLGGLGGYSEQTIGDFRVGVILGRGAMGEVYEAERISNGERCAIKLLHPHALHGDRSALRRFQREARIAASLDVPNVVKVIAVSGEQEMPPYLAMERLEGSDLGALLKARPILPLGEVIDLVRQLGVGLEAARRAGIVHRDLKPQNVFSVPGVDGSVVWKILDFGMSKLSDRHHGTLTRGHVVGTPSYMSPEQARGDEVDYRSDLYALGVIAYRALTGRPVVAAADVPRMLFDVVYTRPPAPSAIARLPKDVDLVLAIALAKDPADRVDSGIELAGHLAGAALGTLPLEIVRRAQAVLARHPWGTVADRPR